MSKKGILSFACAIATVAACLAPQPTFGQMGVVENLSDAPPAESSVIETTNAVTTQIVSPAASTADIGSQSCAFINFEGIGDQQPVPVFDDTSSLNWLALIDKDAGGSGNFANEPTPNTIAFWLGGASGTGSFRDIVFGSPVSKVKFQYASSVNVRIDAFRPNGTFIKFNIRPANYNLGRGDPNGEYNRWDPIEIESSTNEIGYVRVYGAVNQTGIDNLEACKNIGVHSIEFTQAIQQWQDLATLKADLQPDGQPPVPIIATKPLAMRVYLHKLDKSTRVRGTISGPVNQERALEIQPGCTPQDQRAQNRGCQSLDFFFVPPNDSWSVTLTLYDPSSKVIETHTLNLRTRTTKELILLAVNVCDAQDASGNWLCVPDYAERMGAMLNTIRSMAPYSVIDFRDSGWAPFRRNSANSPTWDDWWAEVVRDIGNTYLSSPELRSDLFGNTIHRFHGMVRLIPSSTRGAAREFRRIRPAGSASMVEVVGMYNSVIYTLTEQTLAHEIFHTLGRPHTNTFLPTNQCPTPWDTEGSDWPWPDNGIREVGYDVAARKVYTPEMSFDVMSYCAPMWISAFTYNRMMGVAPPTAASEPTADQSSSAVGDFWLISGAISGGAATFDPIMKVWLDGPTSAESGNFRIEVRGAGNAVLFTRNFEPMDSHLVAGTTHFAELIPVMASAQSLVVLDQASNILGSVNFNGTPPTVGLLSPAAGPVSGSVNVSWAISDPDSPTHTSAVFYSPDGGIATPWQPISLGIAGSSLLVDFDRLPGSNGAGKLRVVVSDGVNSSSIDSGLLTVPKKAPKAKITSPATGSVFQFGQLAWLQAIATDPEEGSLKGAQLTWSSSLDGPIGVGESLPSTSLSHGIHAISVTAKDADGNLATAFTTLQVDSIQPSLLFITQASGNPTNCVLVRAQASDIGSGLATNEYSTNGGVSWKPVPPNDFALSATGFVHLVVRVRDYAGNTTIRDAKFFVTGNCTNPGTIKLKTFIPFASKR